MSTRALLAPRRVRRSLDLSTRSFRARPGTDLLAKSPLAPLYLNADASGTSLPEDVRADPVERFVSCLPRSIYRHHPFSGRALLGHDLDARESSLRGPYRGRRSIMSGAQVRRSPATPAVAHEAPARRCRRARARRAWRSHPARDRHPGSRPAPILDTVGFRQPIDSAEQCTRRPKQSARPGSSRAIAPSRSVEDRPTFGSPPT